MDLVSVFCIQISSFTKFLELKNRWDGGMAQVIDFLPTNYEDLSSTSATKKRKIDHRSRKITSPTLKYLTYLISEFPVNCGIIVLFMEVSYVKMYELRCLNLLILRKWKKENLYAKTKRGG
jgi:hypothetical protein